MIVSLSKLVRQRGKYFRKIVFNGDSFRNHPCCSAFPSPMTGSKFFHTSGSRSIWSFYIDHDLSKETERLKKKFKFPLLRLALETTPSTYYGLVELNNKRKPELEFNVAYVDTKPDADSSTPVVLILHGSPGSHLNFTDVITSLTKEGLRVIAPNWPGYGWTEMDEKRYFRHTTPEKTSFVLDFLYTMKINKIDILLSHSSAIFPSFQLCTRTNFVHSLLLVNPLGHRPMKSLRPMWLFKVHTLLCHNILFRPFLLIFLKMWLVATKYGNKNALLMSVAVETLSNATFQQAQHDIRKIVSSDFPTGVMYSKNDRAVEVAISRELAQLLGANPSITYMCDNTKTTPPPIPGTPGERYIRSYEFKGAGHFVMKHRPEVVHEAVLDLLKVIPQNQAGS